MEPREYERMFALEERHWWYRALRRRIFQALRAARVPPGRVCLDAGCGTGMNLAALQARGVTAYGFDFSPHALAFARRRGLAHLARASAEAIPWRDGCADLVLSADVLYHRGIGDDRRALREMARCLRPGGLLIANVPAFGWLRSAHDEAIHTARRYTRAELIAKLRDAGLEPVRVHYWNWMLFPALAAVRLARAHRSRRRPPTGAAGPPEHSDLAAVPGPLNGLLDAVLALEAALGALPIPAGLSLLAVARKPDAAGASR